MDRINLYFRVRRYLKMLARRWFILVISLAVCAGYAVHKAFTTPNKYRAASKIGIASRVVTRYDDKPIIQTELTSFYETHLQYMQSGIVLRRVEEKMAANRQFANKNFGGQPMATKGIGFFLMTVESTDFEYARSYTTVWAREFMAFLDERTQGAISDTLAETRRDIERYDKKLERARQVLQDFQKTNNIASVKETADSAQQRLDNLIDEFTAVQTMRQRLENKTSKDLLKGGVVESSRKNTEKSSANNDKSTSGSRMEFVDPLDRFLGESKFGQIEMDLRNREAEFQRQQATLKPKHPFMLNLQAEIEKLQREAKYQLDTIEERRLARIESLRRDEESYKPLIENLRKQVFDSRTIQNQFDRLKADETDIKADLENLRKTARTLEAGNNRENLLTILEEGMGNPLPVSPDRQKIILSGLMAGLMLGLGIIYLLDRLDDRLELAEDIENELEEPVLGQIPHTPRKAGQDRLVVTRMDEHSMFSEAMRVVRSAVLLGNESEQKQVIVVSSAVPGDGKTTFTVNFAITMAMAGHKVLLVDCDLRRGNVHLYFGQERAGGFSEVLAGTLSWKEALRETEVPTLHILSTGALPNRPGELLIGGITKAFVKEVREKYDYIIFDCPPLTAIDDTFALVGHADGIMFVVRAGQTSMRFAKNALGAVHQRGARLLGVVLNGITADNPYYYYNHYYHSYYNKGKESSGGGDGDKPKKGKKTSEKGNKEPAGDVT